MKRLVILGSSITALAVARDARAHGMLPVVIDSERGPASRSRWVQFVAVPASSDKGSAELILRNATRGDALVATADHWLRVVHLERARFDAAFGQVLHPANSVLETLLNKSEFSRWCTANGLPTPRAWLPGHESRPHQLSFPMLLRPSQTLHARRELALPKAIEVSDEKTLTTWIHRYQQYGVQPIVSESLLHRDLIQYSVPIARSKEGTLSFVARKIRPAPRHCSVGTCVEVVDNVQIERLGRQAADLCGYFGIGEVEILQETNTGLNYLIEINARPWLQYSLAPASGHDLLGFMFGLDTSRRSPDGATKVWLNFHDDLFAAFSRSVGNVRSGEQGLFEYLRSLSRASVFALFDSRDPAPFIAALRSTLSRRARVPAPKAN